MSYRIFLTSLALTLCPGVAIAADDTRSQAAQADEAGGEGAMKEHARKMRDLRQQIEQTTDAEEQIKLKLQLLQSIGCGPS